jgi:hypothetical protein
MSFKSASKKNEHEPIQAHTVPDIDASA